MTFATALSHPAYSRLHEAARSERRQLARALAIEFDWRYHDGPEWAARYWAAFGDMAAAQTPDSLAGQRERLAARAQWRPLGARESSRTRGIFRALLTAMHPDIEPRAQGDARARLWPRVLRAYRGGDLPVLEVLLDQARRMRVISGLPENVVALRAEHHRLRAVRAAADRRLAERSQQFPFSLRDQLADADWIRRQRLAWRRVLVMAATSRPLAAMTDGKQVS